MQKADALILLINSSSPKGTLTSKVFEYIRIGRPILALVPLHGEAAHLLRTCDQNHICPMESVSAIKACLSEIFMQCSVEREVSPALQDYERSAQVAALHRKLQELVRPVG
ncbi:MAG TPA: hypothetical protein PLX77_06410 [Candidatus Cloacimonadota bacterium]|nr:hypothetical protein [Candidatus Cloacimonadota bacterium]